MNGAWSGEPPDVWTPSASGATVAAAEIETRLAAGVPVVIQTSGGGAEDGDITIGADLEWSVNILALTAVRDIHINAVLGASDSAALSMTAGGAVKVGLTPAGFTGRVDSSRLPASPRVRAAAFSPSTATATP